MKTTSDNQTMRIIVANCSVVYTGRGNTTLNEAVRAIIIKEDGSISIHNDNSNKPLNYMSKGNLLTIEKKGSIELWSFETKKESLQIFVKNIISDSSFPLVIEDEGLKRDGTEFQLQEWLAANPDIVSPGWVTIQREYATGAGAVDLLMKTPEGALVAVEVKRIALSATVYQTLRYVDALRDSHPDKKILGHIIALDVRPNTVQLALKRHVTYSIVPKEWNQNKTGLLDSP